MTYSIILDTILSYIIHNNHIKGYSLRETDIRTLFRKIVEIGTSHTFTLLYIPTNNKKTSTLQNAMQQNIIVKNTLCGHTYEISFNDFLQSNKICKVCTLSEIAESSTHKVVNKYSQHNIQAK